MKKSLLRIGIVLFIISSNFAYAQQKVLTVDDYPLWSRIVGTEISANGDWMAYALRPNGGDDTLYVQSMDKKNIYEIPNANGAEFSKDGNWVSYVISLDKETQKKLSKAKKPIHKTAELLNLQTGEKMKVERAEKHGFSNNSSFWIVHRKKPDDDDSKHKGSDLVIRNLNTNSVTNIGNVSEFALNKRASLLAYLVDANDKVGNGIYTFNLKQLSSKLLILTQLHTKGLVGMMLMPRNRVGQQREIVLRF